jgi:hypothetical protein
MRLRAILLVVSSLGVVALQTPGSSAAPTCQLAGSWPQTTEKIGSSTWSITADGKAQEGGLGGASGTATLSDGVLTITWKTSDDAYEGVYRWTLDAQCAGTGTLTWTKKPEGETRGTTFASTVKGPAPTGPSCPRAEPLCPVKPPPITPAREPPKVGVTTDYRAPAPGKVGTTPVPAAKKSTRTLEGLVRFVDDEGNPVRGPDVAAIEAQVAKAAVVCLPVALRPDDAPGVLDGITDTSTDFATCAAVVARVLARADQIRKQKLKTRAAAAASTCPARAFGPRRARSKLRVTCTPAANGARIAIKARSGTLRSVLGRRKIKLLVGRTSIQPGPAKLRLRVRWTAR